MFSKKTSVLSIICSKCDNEDEKTFRVEQESIELLKILGLLKHRIVPKEYILKINMAEENINQQFMLKNIGETKNYFLKEIKQNELISNKHKKVCKILSYVEHLVTPRQKYPYSDLFWSIFSRIWTEYRKILRISPYSVQMRKNTSQINCEYGYFSRSVSLASMVTGCVSISAFASLVGIPVDITRSAVGVCAITAGIKN